MLAFQTGVRNLAQDACKLGVRFAAVIPSCLLTSWAKSQVTTGK